MPVDPVCGVSLEDEEAVTSTFEGQKYYFCGEECMREFMEAPEDYIGALAESAGQEEW